MKKIFIASIFVLFLGIIPHALAATQGFTALAPIPGLTNQSMTAVVSPNTLATFLNNLYKYLIGLAAILAVIEIIWGGLEIATKDSVSKQSDGRNRITQAILGLVLVLSPVIVFTIINPSILNLSLNLPPINTVTSTASGTGGSNNNLLTQNGGSITPQTTSGCATAINGPIAGTFYTTCTASDNTTAANAASSFVATNCPDSSTKTGGAYGAVGSGTQTTMNSANQVTESYTSYTAKAWCSQIISLTGVYQFSTDITSYIGGQPSLDLIGYFNSSNVAVSIDASNACGNWTLNGNFKTMTDASTLSSCPNDATFHQWFIAHKENNHTPQCGNVNFYCIMPNN